ncbi:phosphonate C-P lyase system protein PhnH [Roseovarius salis]|uniref:phosphonate C-P lyase system protein PhnH n=1 Tax=Roseovarius salis TaxID=3376063 RepID=UPI0037CC52BE
MQAHALEGGFSDAPVQAARAFRCAMRAMACPGTIETLDTARPPAPLSSAAGTLLLTLCDPETGVHLAGGHDRPEVRDWVAFHTGAPVVSAGAARFAIGTWGQLLPLSQYAAGTPEYPDRSATLIVEMQELSKDGTVLTGPGINGRATLSLPDAGEMRANARCFPLGLDFFLTCGGRVAALPRSTKPGGAPCT